MGEQVIVEIERLPFRDARQRAAADRIERRMTALVHPVRKAVDQIFDDAKAVVHDPGADMQRPGAQRDELGGILPGRNATDPRDRDRHRRIAGHRRDEVQGDRLFGRGAGAAAARPPPPPPTPESGTFPADPRPTAETGYRAIGLTAGPQYPPWLDFPPTDGYCGPAVK